MKASDLKASEFNSYYKQYIELAANETLIEGLTNSLNRTLAFLKTIDKNKLEFCYAEGKWTIKEIILHLMDTERVFAYRALRFARQDKTALPGFDQDLYVEFSNANDRTIKDLLSEYLTVRLSTIAMLESFTDAMLASIGEASGNPLTARAAGFIIIGHETHHCNIIKARYL